LSLFVDTSVWSLALRRDAPPDSGEVRELLRAIETGAEIVTTGIVLQELLQGFAGPKARDSIVARFASLPLLAPDRRDHIEAAGLRNGCRRAGVQLGTIDALLAQLCIRYRLTMLTTDQDFRRIPQAFGLRLWTN
jgi:predicted nucleic acid-binding protein